MALTPANRFVVVVKAWLNDKSESNEKRAATDIMDFMLDRSFFVCLKTLTRGCGEKSEPKVVGGRR
jgi:hypothetical protein